MAIEEPFTQDGDGDNFQVDPTGRVSVRTFLPAIDTRPEILDSIREALWYLGRMRTVGDLQVTTIAEEDWANAWKARPDCDVLRTSAILEPVEKLATVWRVALRFGVLRVVNALRRERPFFRAVLDGRLGYGLYWGTRP